MDPQILFELLVKMEKASEEIDLDCLAWILDEILQSRKNFPHYVTEIKKLRIFPLEDGSRVSLGEKKVYIMGNDVVKNFDKNLYSNCVLSTEFYKKILPRTTLLHTLQLNLEIRNLDTHTLIR